MTGNFGHPPVGRVEDLSVSFMQSRPVQLNAEKLIYCNCLMKYLIVFVFSFSFSQAKASCDPVEIEFNFVNSHRFGFTINHSLLDDCSDCFAIEIEAPESYKDQPLVSITSKSYLNSDLLSSSSTPVKTLSDSIEYFGIYMNSSQYKYQVVFSFYTENSITGCDTYIFTYAAN